MTPPRRVPITLPDLGTARAVLGLWYIGTGDRVFEGDRVAEVRIPGATFDVAAPTAGTLGQLLALPLDPVSIGQVLGEIWEDAD